MFGEKRWSKWMRVHKLGVSRDVGMMCGVLADRATWSHIAVPDYLHRVGNRDGSIDALPLLLWPEIRTPPYCLSSASSSVQ